MVMEGPAQRVVPFLGDGFRDIMQQSRPAEPFIVGTLRHIVDHLQRMEEIILVSFTVDSIDSPEGVDLGHDAFENAAFLKELETDRWATRAHDLSEFVIDTFLRDNVDTHGISPYTLESSGKDGEFELSRESHRPHHAQRIVGKRDIRIERRTDDAGIKIRNTMERVDEFAKSLLVKADSHGIYGEVTSFLVVVESAILHNGVAGVAVITLAAANSQIRAQGHYAESAQCHSWHIP